MSASLASLNRAARKAAGLLKRQAAKNVAARAASAVSDAAASDTRVTALRAHLATSPQAQAWVAWATERASERLAFAQATLAESEDLGADPEFLPTESQLETRSERAFARYLLHTAYGVQEARAEAARDYDANHIMAEVSDDDAPHRAARRNAQKQAQERRLTCSQGEPACPSTLRAASAMLALILSPSLVAALPATIRAQLVLFEACRAANMLLPTTAQVEPAGLGR